MRISKLLLTVFHLNLLEYFQAIHLPVLVLVELSEMVHDYLRLCHFREIDIIIFFVLFQMTISGEKGSYLVS